MTTTDLSDPRAFFETLQHDLGPKAKPEYLVYRPREVILEESAPVRRMLIVRHGEVAAWSGGKHVCDYIADKEARHGSLPILSASDYCYSSGSTYTYVAAEHVEILAIDTRVLIDMGKKRTALALLRNMILFSDMGAKLREKIAEEYARTELACFAPDLPESALLRDDPETNEKHYLDFALRALGELTIGRMMRSDHRSTAIVALKRPEKRLRTTTIKE
jgi:hypothetical protein